MYIDFESVCTKENWIGDKSYKRSSHPVLGKNRHGVLHYSVASEGGQKTASIEWCSERKPEGTGVKITVEELIDYLESLESE